MWAPPMIGLVPAALAAFVNLSSSQRAGSVRHGVLAQGGRPAID
jgi:hypothetical protein